MLANKKPKALLQILGLQKLISEPNDSNSRFTEDFENPSTLMTLASLGALSEPKNFTSLIFDKFNKLTKIILIFLTFTINLLKNVEKTFRTALRFSPRKLIRYNRLLCLLVVPDLPNTKLSKQRYFPEALHYFNQ